MSGSPRAILIVKMTAIGDVLMATPLAETVRTAYPDAHIAWLVDERCKDVVQGNPYLDEVIVWQRQKGTSGITTGLPVVRSMRRKRFDVSIDAQGLVRSALMAYLSGARVRTGLIDGKEPSRLLYNAAKEPFSPLVLESHRRLVKPLGIASDQVSSSMLFPLADADYADARELLCSRGVDEQAFAAIAPATTWPNKHWIETRWAVVGDALSSLGLMPLFLGGQADREMIDRIRFGMQSQSVSLAGATSLRRAGALMAMSKLTISVDTGLMHISAALGTPTVAIYGPTTEWVNHMDKPNFRVIREEGLACAPCRKKPTCQNYDCMAAITADEVTEVAVSLLNNTQ